MQTCFLLEWALGLLFHCCSSFLIESREKGYSTVKVYRVLDGDTVIVSTGLRRLIIRLAAIDCPEKGQHWGDTAKYGLIKRELCI